MHATPNNPHAPPGANGEHASAAAYPPGYVERAARIVTGSTDAATNPLPGPLLDAFLPEPLRAAGFQLRPAVASDWAILKRIESPVLREMQNLALPEGIDKPPVKYDEEDVWELLFIFTRTPRDLRAAIAPGRQAFREAAMAATADNLPLEVIKDSAGILAALAANLIRSLSTRLGHQPSGGDPPGSFPVAPPATASAGGSIT